MTLDGFGTRRPSSGDERVMSVCKHGMYFRSAGLRRAARNTHPPIEKAMKESRWTCTTTTTTHERDLHNNHHNT